MKVKIYLTMLIVVMIVPGILAYDFSWTGNITYTPNTVYFGENVNIKARLFLNEGRVNNLKIIGKIGGTVVYNKIIPSVTGPKSLILSYNWKASYGRRTIMMRGRPVRVKVEFTVDPAGTTNDQYPGNNKTYIYIPVRRKIIKIIIAPETTATNQHVKPKLSPCLENSNGTTDIHPVSWDSTRTGNIPGKFSWKIKFMNDGPRCLKKVGYRITYVDQGETKILAQGVKKSGPGINDWLIKAGETKDLTFNFSRGDVPSTAIQTDIDSEVQEIDYEIQFKFKLDPNYFITETNEANNLIIKTLKWTEK